MIMKPTSGDYAEAPAVPFLSNSSALIGAAGAGPADTAARAGAKVWLKSGSSRLAERSLPRKPAHRWTEARAAVRRAAIGAWST